MPMRYHVWERRDGAEIHEVALAAESWCRSLRGQEQMVASRYWIRTLSQLAMLTESVPGSDPLAVLRDREVAKGLFALEKLARNIVSEEWGDARAGTDAYQTAESPSSLS